MSNPDSSTKKICDTNFNPKLATERAQAILAEAPLFLDTETTGFDETDQIIEIAITDANGHVLFESRLQPTVAICSGAQDLHKISMDDLVNAPSWRDISYQIEALLSDRSLIIFNSAYDIRMMMQTAQAFNESTEWITNIKTHCAMEIAAQKYGATNKHGTLSLMNASARAGVTWKGAVADTLALVDLVQAMAVAVIDHE
jgi:DNA polymerase III subunit epsilon